MSNKNEKKVSTPTLLVLLYLLLGKQFPEQERRIEKLVIQSHS
jgi:hypothetical protein